jgi:hypothetical protein
MSCPSAHKTPRDVDDFNYKKLAKTAQRKILYVISVNFGDLNAHECSNAVDRTYNMISWLIYM